MKHDDLPGFNIKLETQKSVFYVPGLDGIRAISVMLVIVSHFGYRSAIPGGLGVTIFFFISGLLITTLLLGELDKTNAIGLKNFYVRRFLRLGPELLFYILITSIIASLAGEPPAIMKLLSAIFYFLNYYTLYFDHPGSGAVAWGQLWSLSVEEHYYLTFPAIVAILGRRVQIYYVLIFAILAPLLWRMHIMQGGFPAEYTNHATDARIDSIAYGCLFSVLIRRNNTFFSIICRFDNLLFIIGIFGLIGSLAIRDSILRETVRYSLQGISIFSLMSGLYGGAIGSRPLKVLEFSGLRWAGRQSYSAYLWHLVPLQLLSFQLGFYQLERLPQISRLFVALALIFISFVLGSLSHRFIFRPVTVLRHRYGSHDAR